MGKKRQIRAEKWFDKEVFDGLEEDEDEDFELEQMSEQLKSQGTQILTKTKSQPENDGHESGYKSDDDYDHSSESDSESEQSHKQLPYGSKHHGESDSESDSDKDIDVKSNTNSEIPTEDNSGRIQGRKFKHRQLTPEQLALGTKMIYSKKAKRDIINDGWNKYMFNDDNLPLWFTKDEKKHMVKPLDMTKKEVDEIKESLTEMNAKARKKKRAEKRMEKARKKSEAILENADMTDKEKANQIKALYKKAKMVKKQDVEYIVARRHLAGKKMPRPKGVKGPYKMVDPRMKKDLKGMAKAKGKSKGRKKK